MKDSTFPICPCYRCHKLLLILPNSPAGCITNLFVLEGMVTCFWGYSWESLIPPSTQIKGMKEGPGTMSSLLFEVSSHVQGHNSFAPQKFLAFVITHHTDQIVPCDVPFVFILLCQGHGQRVGLCPAKSLRSAVMAWGCETLLPAKQRKSYPILTAAGVLPGGSGHTMPSPCAQGCAKRDPVSFRGICC